MQREGTLAFCQDRDCTIATFPHVTHEAPALAPPPVPLSSASFTFTLGRVGRVGAAGAGAVLGGVARVSPAPISQAALRMQQKLLAPPPARGTLRVPRPVRDRRCERKSPSAGCSAVLRAAPRRRDRQRRVEATRAPPRRCSGPTGHYERLSFWTHCAGAGLHLCASTRPCGRSWCATSRARRGRPHERGGVDGISGVFLTSSLYHCTAPDAQLCDGHARARLRGHLHRHHRDARRPTSRWPRAGL